MKPCPTCSELLSDEAMFCPVDGTPLARAPGDPLAGSVIAERFLVLEAIGRGASGVVYRAEDLTTKQMVALKVLHAHLGGDEASLVRYREALAALAQMPSDHLTQLVDAGRVPDGRLFVAMELLGGETLAQRFARHGRLLIAQAIDVAAQVADGLAETHARGWCHGDLRPANLFVVDRPGRPGFVKILDLGLAHLVRESIGAAPALTLGDARYVAPEQARREAADPRTDVYALGLIVYEAIVGQPPFDGAQVFEILQKQVSAAPPPPSARVPGVPSHVDAALLRALAKDRAERWPEASRLVAALRASPATGADPARATGTLPPAPPPAVPPQAGEPPPGGFRPATAPYLNAGGEGAGTPLPSTLAGTLPPAASRETTSPAGRAVNRSTLLYVPPTGAQAAAAASQSVSRGRVATRNMPVMAADVVSGEALSSSHLEEIAEPEPDPAASSSVWFGQGEAASRAVEGGRRVRATGALPSIYDRFHEEEEEARRKPSPHKKLALQVGGAAAGLVVGLVLLLLVTRRSPEVPPGATRLSPADNPLAPPPPESAPASLEPAPAIPDPVFQPFPGAARARAPADAPAVTGKRAPGVPAKPPAAAPGRRPAAPVEAKPAPTRAIAPAAEPATGVKDAEDADAHVIAGRHELLRGNYAKAAEEFAKARAIDPDNVEAIAGLGELAFEQGYYAQAAERLKAAVRVRPRSVRYLVLLGNSFFKLGQMRSAVEIYRRALDIDPGNEEALGGVQAAEKRLGGT
ncbi:MAG: serine/threonine-protein kinase [Myxococcota bacterium]